MRKFLLPVFLVMAANGTGGAQRHQLSYMDKSVKPGNDFFLYGNGGWMPRCGDSRPTAPMPGSIWN